MTARSGPDRFSCRTPITLLDNRPALVSTRAGELLVVGSADERRQFHKIEKYATPTGMNPNVPVDPFNNDLYANLVTLNPRPDRSA